MRHLSIAAIALALFSTAVRAQDDKPLMIGDFENTGSVTMGYRAVSVSGYQPMYRNLFDLNSGFRLLDFSLFGKAKPDTNAFADTYSIVSSGIGGDPWSTTQLTVAKDKLYDLRASFRQSYYYIDPNSTTATPSGQHGLLSDHNWQTVRKMGSLNLLVHATNNLKFSFEYGRNTRDGGMDTTRAMDYFGAPSTFGGFSRANPYYLVGLINETTDRVAGGIDYTHGSWTLHYKAGWQRFEDSFTGSNPIANETSINVDDTTTSKELLASAQWKDFHRFSTPSSELSWNGKLLPRLKLFGSYLYFDYSGPASLAMSASGLARGSTTSVIQGYSFSDNSTANLKEPNHAIEQGFSWEANDWLSMEAAYRYNRLHVTADTVFNSISNCCGAAVANGTVQNGTQLNEWLIGTSTAWYDLTLTPISSLMVRMGVQYLKNDVEFRDDGIADPLATKRIRSVLPSLSVSYKPNKVFSIRGNLDQLNNGASYTRATPHTDLGSRIVTRIRPLEKFWIENTTAIQNRKLLTSNYTSHVRNNTTTLTYELNERLSGFAGFSYNSFYSQSFVNFLRGTAPITNVTLTDQEVERLWQAGLNAAPVKRVTLSFAGNFVRVNGLGVVMGEKPLYGPMTFPTASGSLSYDCPKVGTISIQLQRTYYVEQIIPGNNFGADLLTVAWKRSF